MILVDTGVWIDYLNGVVSKHTDLLDSKILEGGVVMGDLIFLEILQGIRTEREYRKTKKSLLTLEQFQLFGSNMPEKCVDNYRALRRKGITIRKTADVIIATFCIEHKISLLFVDRDFAPFVDHLSLRAAMV